MATNPAPEGRRKYCPVNEAPEPGLIRERSPTDYETPQLRTLRYRSGYTPGVDPYLETEQRAVPDKRQTAGNV